MTTAAITLWLTGGAMALAAVLVGDMTVLFTAGCVYGAGCIAWLWDYL